MTKIKLLICAILFLTLSELQAFSFKFHLFNIPTVAQLTCTSITTCYQKKQIYNKAIFNGEYLITRNNFLYSPSNSRYLGTQCANWYSESELFWVDKKLNSTGTNWVNISWYYNSSANEVGFDPRVNVTPTCGTVHFREVRNNTPYGYCRLYVDDTVYFAGGNGGNFTYNVDISVNKGQSLQLGSHYYQYGYLNAGY